MSIPPLVVRASLIEMCTRFVNGASIFDCSGAEGVCANTLRARRKTLEKIGVKMSVMRLPGRGFGIPVYKLAEPLSEAISKIDAKYANMPESNAAGPSKKAKKKKKQYKRDDIGQIGLHDSQDIGGWLFITADRAAAYKAWCEEWTK